VLIRLEERTKRGGTGRMGHTKRILTLQGESASPGRGQAKQRRSLCYPRPVPDLRSCTVSLRDPGGITHTVQVHGESLFEAAARAVSAFREQGWGADALTPNAVLRVEVYLPTVVHEVPLKAVQRWIDGPSVTPKEQAAKAAFRKMPRTDAG
jgi:hypothetical protein